MKAKALLFSTAALVAASTLAHAAIATKSATGTDLTSAASWNSGLPGTSDIATWDTSSLGAGLTVGSAVSWGSINITGAQTNIGITGAGTITTGNITLAGAQTLSIANAIALSGNSIYDIADVTGTSATDATLSGIVSGAFGITKSGAGILVFSNSGTNYSGATNVNAGTLVFTAPTDADWTAPSGTKTVASGATLKYVLPSSPSTYRAVNIGTNIINSGGFLELNAIGSTSPDLTYLTGGTITGTGTIVKTGAGYTRLDGVNGFNGAIDVQAGILGTNGATIGSGLSTLTLSTGTSKVDVRTGTFKVDALNGVAGSNVYVSHTTGGTLSVGNNNGTGTFAGTLTNGGSGLTIIKNGTGTQTLTGANTFTGGTIVSGGALVTGNTAALGGGAVAVNTSGAKLQIGDGTVNTVTLGSGATLAIANGAILKLGAFNAASLDTASGVVALAGTGTYTFNTSGKLDLGFVLDGITSGTHNYRLFSGGNGVLAGGELQLANISGFGAGITLNSFTNGVLSFTAVPEPSTYGLIGAGALASVAFVRRRRKHAGVA